MSPPVTARQFAKVCLFAPRLCLHVCHVSVLKNRWVGRWYLGSTISQISREFVRIAIFLKYLIGSVTGRNEYSSRCISVVTELSVLRFIVYNSGFVSHQISFFRRWIVFYWSFCYPCLMATDKIFGAVPKRKASIRRWLPPCVVLGVRQTSFIQFESHCGWYPPDEHEKTSTDIVEPPF